MREPGETMKQVLRHLAAARFYLPEQLKPTEFGADEQYLRYLHHGEYGLALDEIAAIGEEHRGFAEERLFWRELELAAIAMDLCDKAAEYRKASDGYVA